MKIVKPHRDDISMCVTCMTPVIQAVDGLGMRRLYTPNGMTRTGTIVVRIDDEVVARTVEFYQVHKCEYHNRRAAARIRSGLKQTLARTEARRKYRRPMSPTEPDVYELFVWKEALIEISKWNEIECPKCNKPPGEMCRNMGIKKKDVPVLYPHEDRCYKALAQRGLTVVTNKHTGWVEVWPPKKDGS